MELSTDRLVFASVSLVIALTIVAGTKAMASNSVNSIGSKINVQKLLSSDTKTFTEQEK